MVKKTTTLSIEHELIELAKAKQMNISQFVNSLLSVQLGIEDDTKDKNATEIDKLKSMNAVLTGELIELTKKLEKAEKKSKEVDIPWR